MAAMTWQQAANERIEQQRATAALCRVRAKKSLTAAEAQMMTTAAMVLDFQSFIDEGVLRKSNLAAAADKPVIVDAAAVASKPAAESVTEGVQSPQPVPVESPQIAASTSPGA